MLGLKKTRMRWVMKLDRETGLKLISIYSVNEREATQIPGGTWLRREEEEGGG